MNDLQRMKIALGAPYKTNLDGVEYEFYPLSISELIEYYEITRRVGGNMDNVTKEDLLVLTELIMKMVRRAFTADVTQEDIDRFVIKYYYDLQLVFAELHSPQESKNVKIQELKKRLEKKNESTGVDKK